MVAETEDEADRIAREHAIATAPDRLAPGDIVRGNSSVRVERLLAKGGMSEVYVVTHVQNRVKLALKVPRGRGPLPREERQSIAAILRDQAQQLAKLGDLKRFVRVFDTGIDPDRELPYLLMELVDGRTLAELARARAKPFTAPEAIRVVRVLASTLGRMHALGLAHGDVKPANVMLREREHRGANLVILDVAVRSSWRSPLYLAPEGFEMRGMTPAEDVYALGLFLYEMLAGAHPFGAYAGDLMAIARAQIRMEPAPIRELASTVTPELAAIVERMIAKDPAKRYATGADVKEALDRYIIGARVCLPLLEEMFHLAPATERAPPVFELVEDEHRWTRHDGVDEQGLEVAHEQRREGPWRLVVIQGPRRLLGLRARLGVGRWSFGRAFDQDIVLPHLSVGSTHGTLTLTADGAMHVADDGEHVVEREDGNILVGKLALRLFTADDTLPVWPAIPDDLFEEAERILRTRPLDVGLMRAIAETSPAPSRRMSLANVDDELLARGIAEAAPTAAGVVGGDIATIADILAGANTWMARAEIRAGQEPNEVIRRRLGEPIDWKERARAFLAATKLPPRS